MRVQRAFGWNEGPLADDGVRWLQKQSGWARMAAQDAPDGERKKDLLRAHRIYESALTEATGAVMTVAEYIAALQQLPQEAEVVRQSDYFGQYEGPADSPFSESVHAGRGVQTGLWFDCTIRLGLCPGCRTCAPIVQVVVI